ncbi:TolB family protein [Risungbinella massiliensis]|uniref:TolB family protein n=1 Tax=Risungbinella massiliensis TaxID=1329796 RepID=UPI0005CC59BA|nr:PD40 domain-containing protein [Risungbinella massiliensis]
MYLMNADGTNKRQVTGDPSNETSEYGASYSPDGKTIAYSRSSDVYTMNPDGTNQINRTSHISDHVVFSIWSPNSKKIMFHNGLSTGTPNKMYIMNVDGSNLQIFDNGKLMNNPIAWIR